MYICRSKVMSYLLSIVIQLSFHERLNNVKGFMKGFFSLFAQVGNTLKGDLGPLIFLPVSNLKMQIF